MIKEITIRGFESYEDSTFANFSPGLNAIVGNSNSGKSACVRALALIAYNQYDPESLRKGCDNCYVKVVTDKGIIEVTRGKLNRWEITDKAGNKQTFDRVGRQILPQVTEILGFGIVKLGDMEMKVNIMDQLEAHFMLAEFAGQDATGSLRAQVVDEISGLSGIETLIRDVSLDGSRLGREISQTEDRNKEISGKLNDENELIRETRVLKTSGEHIKTYDESAEAVTALVEILDNHSKELEARDRVQSECDQIPDDKQVLAVLLTAERFCNDATAMNVSHIEWCSANKSVQQISIDLSHLPDDKTALVLIDKADKSLSLANEKYKALADTRLTVTKITILQIEISKHPNIPLVIAHLAKAEVAFQAAQQASQALDVWLTANTTVKEAEDYLRIITSDTEKAEREYKEILSTFKVCPLTTKPITGECLKDVVASGKGN